MLDLFLESGIQKKLHLYNLLHTHKSVDINAISKTLETAEPAARSLLKELMHDLDGLAEISQARQSFSLHIGHNTNPLTLLHAIYSHSIVLQCMKFLLTNTAGKSYLTFAETTYLSTAHAYRIKKKCQEYLRNIGLDIKNNRVVGEEYRIRYLIALLHYKYGIKCCDIDQKSIDIARKFILSTNQVIDLNFLEASENEYAFSEYLFILSWKRRQYVPFLQTPAELDRIKSPSLYHDLQSILKECVEAPLHISFSQLDYDYIYLVYYTTNNPLFADRVSDDKIERFFKSLLLNEPKYSSLLLGIENRFEKKVAESDAMKIVLFYFCRKFLLELQCIVPDTCFYSDSKKHPLTVGVLQEVTDMIDAWRNAVGLSYPIDPEHIQHLAVQIEAILRQFTTPVPLVVATDRLADLEVMTLALNRYFPAQRVTVTQCLTITKGAKSLSDLKDHVIVVNKKFLNMADALGLPAQNAVVPVTTKFNLEDVIAVHDALTQYEDKNFMDLLKSSSPQQS